MVRYGSPNRIRQLEIAAGIEQPESVPNPLAEPSTKEVAAPAYVPVKPQAAEKPVSTSPKQSFISKAADYLSGRSALRSAMAPGNVTATGNMLAAARSNASRLMPLSSIPEIQKKSVRGSGAYTEAEIKQGYRKMGKGLVK